MLSPLISDRLWGLDGRIGMLNGFLIGDGVLKTQTKEQSEFLLGKLLHT